MVLICQSTTIFDCAKSARCEEWRRRRMSNTPRSYSEADGAYLPVENKKSPSPVFYINTRGGEQSSTRYHPILAARQPSQPLTRPLSVT